MRSSAMPSFAIELSMVTSEFSLEETPFCWFALKKYLVSKMKAILVFIVLLSPTHFADLDPRLNLDNENGHDLDDFDDYFDIDDNLDLDMDFDMTSDDDFEDFEEAAAADDELGGQTPGGVVETPASSLHPPAHQRFMKV